MPETLEQRQTRADAEFRETRRRARLETVGKLVPAAYRGGFRAFKAELPEKIGVLGICRRFIDEFPAHDLLMNGRVGTGKTHLAWAIWAELYLREPCVRGEFIRAQALLRRVQEAWKRRDTSPEQEIQRYAEAGLLILDEVGAGASRNDEKMLELLTEVIGARNEWRRPTVLISNLTEREVGELLGERIKDRLDERALRAVFPWASHRRNPAAGDERRD